MAQFEDAALAPMQADCYYVYATADENVITHTDPLAAYELVLTNHTGRAIQQGSLSLSLEIPTTVGGPPEGGANE